MNHQVMMKPGPNTQSLDDVFPEDLPESVLITEWKRIDMLIQLLSYGDAFVTHNMHKVQERVNDDQCHAIQSAMSTRNALQVVMTEREIDIPDRVQLPA